MTARLAPRSGRRLLLRGSKRVPVLSGRRNVSASLRTSVPASAPARTYRLMICLKVPRVPAQCRTAQRRLRVRARSSAPPPSPAHKDPPAVSITSPVEGAEDAARRPELSGSASPGYPRTVTVAIHPGTGTSAAPVQSLQATVADSGAWSVTATGDLPPGPYTTVATQGNDAGDPGRSAERHFGVPAVLVSAGDIAGCDTIGDEATAALLDQLGGDVVAALGDNVYEDGTLQEFQDCYGPAWGRQLARTRPVVGNHEYTTPDAAGYFDYFGAAAGERGKGYYSYDLGSWHVVALNSNCTEVRCDSASAQAAWLRQDLAAHPAACTLAYWHHPRFSSSALTGPTPAVAPLWQILDDAGADVVLSGHAHIYERFDPQTSAGAASADGVRGWIVGTGGRSLHAINPLPADNSRVRDNSTFGVLDLTLRATGYDWNFVPVAGGDFKDRGSASCV